MPPEPLPTITIDAALDGSSSVPAVRHFARALAHVIGALGVTDGILAAAAGSHTVMFVFHPSCAMDASRVIGRRGAISKALRELAKAVGTARGMNLVFKAEDWKEKV